MLHFVDGINGQGIDFCALYRILKARFSAVFRHKKRTRTLSPGAFININIKLFISFSKSYSCNLR